MRIVENMAKIAKVATVTIVFHQDFEGEIGVLCKIGSKFGNGNPAIFCHTMDVVVKVRRTPTPALPRKRWREQGKVYRYDS